ncbi:putative peptidoglycan glycosyltransferase FtsW [bioreactor metagenome]|uniref:peptidoglycan glycosyltransferase n=1 Tax=bioreactor metagenome TaxID=1076179 RepID=A0A644YHP5_9ZZZZ
MKKPKMKLGEVDFILFATILMLVTVGVVMVYSASSYFAAFRYEDPEYFLWRQLFSASIGMVAMFFTLNTDYHKLKKYTRILIIFTFIALCLVFVFPPVNGAQRWIRLGPLSFQPSELTKYVVVLYVAKSIEAKGERIKLFLKGVIPHLAFAGFFAGMVILEKNLSIATVIMLVTVAMLFIGGTKFSYIAEMGLGLLGLVGLAIWFEPYRMKRITGFLDPWSDSQVTGYQLVQSLLALGSGGLTGVGIGQSRQKCFYIPEPHNDFIFSVIGEELGFIGCMFIVILFIIFLWRGIMAASKAKDVYGALLATGITAVVILQSLINIAVVTGSMPVTGVPLPFISYGGTSLAINMMFMGVLLNITRQNNS